MCGIAGYVCAGDARPPLKRIKQLWAAQQTRGTDASGIAYVNNAGTGIEYVKAPVPSGKHVEMLNDDHWALIARSPRMLCHARATTKGSEKDNENNHPVVGHDWVVTHNGHVTNDDDLFEHYSPGKRFAKVDSAAIPLVLGQGGEDLDKCLQHLSLLGGNATVAAWGTRFLDTVCLARFGHNDLFLFMDPADKILYWSSASIVGRIMPGTVLNSLLFLNASKLPEDRILVLPSDWATKSYVLRVARNSFFPSRAPVGASSTTSSGGATNGGAAARSAQTFLAEVPRRGGAFQSGDVGRRYPSGSGFQSRTEPDRSWKWERTSVVPGKPGPYAEGLHCNWWNLFNLEGEVLQQDLARTIEAGYGRWTLTRRETRRVEREFHPYRRTSDWWRTLFPDVDVITLPAMVAPAGTWLDNRESLEIYKIRTLNGGSLFESLGYMCPWCGIWEPKGMWTHSGGRCQFCNVRSQIPATTEVSA